MAKIKQYQFNTQAVTVVTPLAETLFMCLADVNEVSGTYGGKLIFTEEALNTKVKYKVGKGKESVGIFKDIVDNVIEEAYQELVADGKRVSKADKIVPSIDKDGNDNGKYEMSVKNQDKPRILNTDRREEKDFDKLVGNGSTMKAQLYLKPYTMQGKVGVTAYLNTALLFNVIEYGASNDMFDDDDFSATSDEFDDIEDNDNDNEDF
jgi:hypothetical protein